ncbi:DUF6319 family protein [Aldersonia kunmingensis]|uniref:DUF6319 family protein n=1 Tax=Aldersonia kunmingensis TaxID=408066 RepID=UPI00082ADBBA|nr:DUF6319 family protein [Aldersonia kunmingensis]
MASGTPRTGLSGDDLTALGDALAQGARAAVYLRDPVPSLGLAAWTSAKVVSISGTTLLVRPRGVDDELPFEADELQMTKPPAPKPSPSPAPKPAPQQPAKPEAKISDEPEYVPSNGARSASNGATSIQPKVTTTPPKSTGEQKVTAKTKPAARPAARGRKTPTTVTVTLHADLDGAWTVAVQQGDRPAAKPVPVNADAVERAVTELGEPGAERAVQTALEAAREVAAARVEELTKQLEEARGTLAALGAVEAGNGRGGRERSS